MEHPFQIGTQVAIVGTYNYTQTKVLKVYKNGNFTLEADPTQQWKPYRYNDTPWSARRTGERLYSFSPTVRIVDDEFKTEQAEAEKKQQLKKRAHKALHDMRNARGEFLTEWQVEALENFVRLYKGCD